MPSPLLKPPSQPPKPEPKPPKVPGQLKLIKPNPKAKTPNNIIGKVIKMGDSWAWLFWSFNGPKNTKNMAQIGRAHV